MIYLIGGAPRCGKTTLAKTFSKKTGIPWISSDSIESMIYPYVSKKQAPKLFPKSFMRRKTGQSNDRMFDSFSVQEIVRAYIAQAKTAHEAILTLADASDMEGHDYIIEGHHLHPGLMRGLINKIGRKNIKALVLSRSDKEKIVADALKNKAKNDWFIKKTKKDGTYPKIAAMVVEYGSFFKKEARRNRIRVFDMDQDFAGSMKEALKFLLLNYE